MIGKTLYYGKHWGDKAQVDVFPPHPETPYWEIIIQIENEKTTIKASKAVAVYENGKLVEIHY